MSRILFILLAIVGIILAALIVAPGLIPAATYKERIETAATSALGRQVTIGDDISIRIFPQTSFKANNLAIANAEGFEGETLARVANADIGVKLFPLFSGAVIIDRFVLIEPEITLARKANGDVNWNLTTNDTVEELPADDTPQDSGSSVRDISLGDVRIVDGKATFTDGAAKKTYALDDIDIAVRLTSLNEPLEVDGNLVFQNAPANIDLVLTTLDKVMKGETADLKMDLKLGDTQIGVDLDITNGEALRYVGPVNFNAPDLPAFAALAGTELADAPGFDRLSFEGDVDGGPTAIRVANAMIGFDEIEAQGALDLNWSGARPKAGGVLSTDLLDLRPYMPPPAQSAEGFPEWSNAPMDLTALRNVDADFDISTDQILLNDLKIDESRLKLAIENGRMTADIPELSMYGGQGSGRIVVNARGQTPSFAGNFDMGAVQAQPMTLDLMKHDNLLGLGSFKLDFTASGASQAAIMSSIDGSGGFDLADGALKGVNIQKITQAAASLTQGGINPAALANAVATARGPREETDFSEFLSNFSIENGLINAPTISLTGPYLTMDGRGQINLAAQTIDLRLAPKAATSADGQTGRSIAVPVRVGGTFAKPTIGVDGEALAKAFLQNNLGGFLGGGAAATPEDAARNAIQGILGGGKSSEKDGEKTDASAEEELLNQGLNALFGRKKSKEDEKVDNDKD
ncbi:MAG: AsmA family protein [Pseudomonadota bacterium]